MNAYFWIGLALILLSVVIQFPNWISAVILMQTNYYRGLGQLVGLSFILFIGIVLLIIGIYKNKNKKNKE
jgi:hypothetical protein